VRNTSQLVENGWVATDPTCRLCCLSRHDLLVSASDPNASRGRRDVQRQFPLHLLDEVTLSVMR